MPIFDSPTRDEEIEQYGELSDKLEKALAWVKQQDFLVEAELVAKAWMLLEAEKK